MKKSDRKLETDRRINRRDFVRRTSAAIAGTVSCTLAARVAESPDRAEFQNT